MELRSSKGLLHLKRGLKVRKPKVRRSHMRREFMTSHMVTNHLMRRSPTKIMGTEKVVKRSSSEGW